MEKKKFGNGGFSLIELIITVLVMAIIMVALAPQVMKWVNNARISTDVQLGDSLVSSARYALADPGAYQAAQGKVIAITLNENNCKIESQPSGQDIAAFVTAFASSAGVTVSGSNADGFIADGLKLKMADGQYSISVVNGIVSGTPGGSLFSDDLDITVAAASLGAWSTYTPTATGSPSGTVGSYTGGAKPDPTKVIHKKEFTTVAGATYLDNTLCVNSTSDLANVQANDSDAPLWVYVGLSDFVANGSDDYSRLVLYVWDGSKDGTGNPIWTKKYVNGL